MNKVKATLVFEVPESALLKDGRTADDLRNELNAFRDEMAKDESIPELTVILRVAIIPPHEHRDAKRYQHIPEGTCRQGQEFIPWNTRGYLSLRVLPFLEGKPWDDVALGFVHSLRPSEIRVIPHGSGMHCDCHYWRVTVELKANGTIDRIMQEVEVGLPESVPHGSGLLAAHNHGMDSEQLKWHNLPGGTVATQYGTYKTVDGKSVPYPKEGQTCEHTNAQSIEMAGVEAREQAVIDGLKAKGLL